MNKEEIKDYLKRADELELKLTGEDKDTYQWILFGYNQCAKLLNETEQQCKKQKEVIDKVKEYIWRTEINSIGTPLAYVTIGKELLDILKEVSK